jgi:uncharacterized protein (TIGR03435 family)
MIAYAAGNSFTWSSVEVRHQPDWLAEYYDIEARVSQADLKAWQNQLKNHELLRSALRAALKERCKLAIGEEWSQARMFELVIAKGGPKLRTAALDAALPLV